jgi:predicted O-methyltransferase YrrM
MSRRSIDLASSITGATVAIELSKLAELASYVKKGLIVEIGSYLGRSSIILGLEAQENDTQLICIDPFIETPKKDFETNMKNAGVKDYKLIAGRSEDVVDKVPDNIDFLFVDGDHIESNPDTNGTSGVDHDCDNYIPKVKKGGIVAFHDYGSSWEDVKKVVDSRKDIKIIDIVHTLCVTQKE